ncbi:MAG TPA: hypothetical protein VGN43_08125 [Steroidobacteraceae bacterium]|nr:hypothetical protein [Steroidobacteraceae bacterium]
MNKSLGAADDDTRQRVGLRGSAGAAQEGPSTTASAMSDEAMRLGLLMEAAQAQQRLGQESLERLAAHTRELDVIVRDEVRRTLAEELGSVAAESRRAVESLQRMRRAANVRVLLWTVSIAAVCSAVAMGEMWWLLPSQSEVAALRARRDALAANIARLQQRGGSVELRSCGAHARLCVRVDRNAPAYGADADYLIVKGN